jgi:hypothetical protein
MLVLPADLRHVHALVGPLARTLSDRRAVYSAAAELFTGEAPADESILDSPFVRHCLGQVLGGAAGIVDLTTPEMVSCVSIGELDLFCGPHRAEVFDPVVRRLTDDLRREGALEELTVSTTDHEGFSASVEMLAAGLRLLEECAPDLAADLLPHISLVAFVRPSGRLGSASFKDYPGLIVLPEPQSASEVAEALAHEGAHVKFFDLDLTRGLLAPSRIPAPAFAPSWRSAAAPWPFAQCLAAFHAYRCIAAVASTLSEAVHPGSLMPEAEQRADELARWLGQNAGDHLSAAGIVFVRALGVDVGLVAPVERARGRDPDGAIVRDCGERRLVVVAGQPIELFWVRKG